MQQGALAAREFLGLRVGQRPEFGEVEHALDLSFTVGGVLGTARQEGRAQILGDGQAAEQTRDLKRAHQAAARDLVRRQAVK